MNFNKKAIVNYKANPVTTSQRSMLTSSFTSSDSGIPMFDTDLRRECYWDGEKTIYTIHDTDTSGSILLPKNIVETFQIANNSISQINVPGTGQDNFGVYTKVNAGKYNSFGFNVKQAYGGSLFIKFAIYDLNYNRIVSHVQSYPSGLTIGTKTVILQNDFKIYTGDHYYFVLGQWNTLNQPLGILGSSGIDPNDNTIKFSINGGGNSNELPTTINTGRNNSGTSLWIYIKYT